VKSEDDLDDPEMLAKAAYRRRKTWVVGILSLTGAALLRTNPLVGLRMAVRWRLRLTGLNRGDGLLGLCLHFRASAAPLRRPRY